VGSSDFKGAQMTDYQSSVCNMAVQHKDRVVFTGYIDNMNLYRYHKSADIAVVPSICEEAFNIAILEFLASGIPTIATRSGGLVEEGTSATTLFIDKEHDLVNSIRKAIMELYNNPSKLSVMSKRSVERSRLFDKNMYLNEFENVINQLGQNE
ncbi:glycosyltransferase, partial [Phocaeicola dorei]